MNMPTDQTKSSICPRLLQQAEGWVQAFYGPRRYGRKQHQNFLMVMVWRVLTRHFGIFLSFTKMILPSMPSLVRWHASDCYGIHCRHSLKKNRKFFCKVIRTGARSNVYEDALERLKDAGVIYRIRNISKPGMPLTACRKIDAFKIYACDTGLMRRLAKLPADIIASSHIQLCRVQGSIGKKCRIALPCHHRWLSTRLLEFAKQVWGGICSAAWHRNYTGRGKGWRKHPGKSFGVYDDKYLPNHRCRFPVLNLQFNGNLPSCPSPLIDRAYDLLKTVNCGHWPSLRSVDTSEAVWPILMRELKGLKANRNKEIASLVAAFRMFQRPLQVRHLSGPLKSLFTNIIFFFIYICNAWQKW